MIEKLEKKRLKKRYGGFVLPEKSAQEVILTLEKKYEIKKILYQDMDRVSQDIHQSICKAEIFQVGYTDRTKLFFDSVEKTYGSGVGVYIFLIENQLISNCRELELEMIILSGISRQDIQEETLKYFHYLLQFELYKRVTHTNWSEGFLERG
jgi:hypothetical protein